MMTALEMLALALTRAMGFAGLFFAGAAFVAAVRFFHWARHAHGAASLAKCNPGHPAYEAALARYEQRQAMAGLAFLISFAAMSVLWQVHLLGYACGGR